MTINATLLGQLFAFALYVLLVRRIRALAGRKTENPRLVTAIGLVRSGDCSSWPCWP
ncbi:hypothetical protein [Gallaecimonas sp. GXIMD4217]|uniref:hypothetical protein n=1 Tax=Gallaecimonas sp. GXIMD4217 TaxID=3131927 RepID=UPI00311B23DD